ncbi:hypothetical protein Q1W73_14245 [Asticcacaulis sp. ZE23SCel15]|uniref:ATP synthase subunit b n=1 Tax=Asticcacaulis machinosus TaxID=2984211 RepID=A0ABT5HFK5_9CAUL|nr:MULTISPECIES: hypothetical protein [Asticcacaulis]MDC7674973.1 hypothetical protein [Asticcacaulis machinosus]WAC49027.1 hypothetical protein OVA03_03680 [Asticcacaulis sp. SL142]WKL56815.1 hypothetical protein Q1W73_14245 [Asticcacaulis sp. ZE23SCel15]
MMSAANDTLAMSPAAEPSDTAPVTTVATLDPVATAPADAHADTHESTEHAGGEAHAKGLPQFQTEHWAGQIVWLVIIFTILYIAIAKMFAPKLRGVISTRGSTISEDLANARAIRDEAEAQAKMSAEETAAAHAAARKLASDAKTKAAAESAKVQAEEDAKLNALIEDAETSIRASRDKAMAYVEDIATETASVLVEKLTGKAATKTALKAALSKA